MSGKRKELPLRARALRESAPRGERELNLEGAGTLLKSAKLKRLPLEQAEEEREGLLFARSWSAVEFERTVVVVLVGGVTLLVWMVL